MEKTKQLIDQCMTAYLLARLKHDEGDTSESVPQSPILETNEILDGEHPALQHTLAMAPIKLSRRPVRQVEEQSRSRPRNLHDFSRADSGPYSTSSPGSFFTAHMEKRDHSLPRSRSRDPRTGEETSRAAHFDQHYNGRENEDIEERKRADTVRNLFKPLQEYIISSFGSFECINSSFSTLRPTMSSRSASEGGIRRPMHPHHYERRTPASGESMSELDAKTLLLGDFAENGTWWTGGREDVNSPERPRMHRHTSSYHEDFVTIKSPRLDWAEMNEWYFLILNAGRLWRRKLDELISSDPEIVRLSGQEMHDIEDQINEAQSHAQRVLLKVTESLLKRPSRPLKEPSDLRFLLIILANPLLYPSPGSLKPRERSRSRSRDHRPSKGILGVFSGGKRPPSPNSSNTSRGSSGQHSGIIKRILGLLAYTPNECHHYLISWFARYSDSQFQRTTDLIGSFVTYRLTRQHGKRQEVDNDPTAGLVPSMSGRSTSAALHAALGVAAQPPKKKDGKSKPVIYTDDWQIKAAARVMQLLFTANNSGLAKRGEPRQSATLESGHSAGLAARERAHIHGQILPTSDFYNTLLDYSDLVADFDAWEKKRGKFTFCQYPFFLSIWAKIQIMEHDARRQMEVQASEAFFNSVMSAKTFNQYLYLRVRRDCLVEDSLKGVSEVVGAGGEEIKKALRIEFKGEEGVDAGGLRKEWFLLLVRDIFNPEHGELYANVSLRLWTLIVFRHVYLRRRLSILLFQSK